MAERELSIPEPSLQHFQRRREFLIRTYGHLLAGVVAFVVLEMVYFATGLAEAIAACAPLGELASSCSALSIVVACDGYDGPARSPADLVLQTPASGDTASRT